MNLKKYTVIFVLALLFSSCSNMRFGHLAKVKQSPHSKINSYLTTLNNIKIEADTILLSTQNFESYHEDIVLTTDFTKQNITTSKIAEKQPKNIVKAKPIIPENIATKQDLKNKNFNNPGRNQNAYNSFIFGILALVLPIFATLILISIFVSANAASVGLWLIFAYIFLGIATIYCAYQAFFLGIKGLKEINQEGLGFNRGQAIFGIIIGGLYLLSTLITFILPYLMLL